MLIGVNRSNMLIVANDFFFMFICLVANDFFFYVYLFISKIEFCYRNVANQQNRFFFFYVYQFYLYDFCVGNKIGGNCYRMDSV